MAKKNDSIPILGPTPMPSRMPANKGIIQNAAVKSKPVAKMNSKAVNRVVKK